MNNQMPHNLDAEAALLGCILLDESIQSELLEQLREEDLYQESHREILVAMKAVYGARKPVDLVTLADELDRTGKTERAGGIAYITELAQITPSVANYRQYLDIVRRDSINRTLVRAAKAIVENSMKGGDERDALAFAEKQIYDVSKREDKTTLEGLADGGAIQDVLRYFEEIQADPNARRGVPTGFKHLDKITGGLQKGDLIVLAARPGMGKTSLAMNIVENAALRKGKICAVFSLEMPRRQILQRLLCAYGNVSMERALAGRLVQSEWKNLLLAGDKLQKSRLYIDDSSRVTPAEIMSKCRRLSAQEGGLDLVMIDYIQLMGGAEKTSGGDYNRQQEIASITRDLKIMAKELNVPVLALSQLRRIQTKEPQLSDLRESGAIEQDADIVMFINRPDVGASPEEIEKNHIVQGAAYLQIAKHRNGAQGRIQLRFLGERTKFVDVDEQNAPGAPQDVPKDTEDANPAEEAFGPQDDDSGIPY